MKKNLFWIGLILISAALYKLSNELVMIWRLTELQNYVIDGFILMIGFTFFIWSFVVKEKTNDDYFKGLIKSLAEDRNRNLEVIKKRDDKILELAFKLSELRKENEEHRKAINCLEFELKQANNKIFSLNGNFAQSKRRYKEGKKNFNIMMKNYDSIIVQLKMSEFTYHQLKEEKEILTTGLNAFKKLYQDDTRRKN